MEIFKGWLGEAFSVRVKVAEVEESADVVTFVREKLGFDPDAKQELVLRGGRRGIVNCTRQMGEVDRHCGQGGASRLLSCREPYAGGDSERAAERGVSAKGGRICAPVGNQG